VDDQTPANQVLSRREYWWNQGETQAVMVYRAKVALPMLVLTAVVLAPFIAFSDMRRPGSGPFIVAMWLLFTVPILIRRRRAAIFTTDLFLYRPVFGRPLKVPLNGIKSAQLLEPEPTAEIYVPKVRIELFVGGELTLPMAVTDPEAVVRRLNAAAKRATTSPGEA